MVGVQQSHPGEVQSGRENGEDVCLQSFNIPTPSLHEMTQTNGRTRQELGVHSQELVCEMLVQEIEGLLQRSFGAKHELVHGL